jgi:branched-chain amino acid transport system permease protein
MIPEASYPLAFGLADVFSVLVQYADAFALLFLAAIGLAIIFGIMGVINLAHGELIMVGSFTTTLSYEAGFPLPAAMVTGVVVTTVFGVILERLFIQHLYGRLVDSMVATFGLGLIISQGARIVFGSSLPQIGTPLGALSFGVFSFSAYRVMLAGVSVLTGIAVYLLFTRTRWGVRARATIQNESMARNLGTDTERMYISTFALGSALAGLTGALYAPTQTQVPLLGREFLFEAFVTVVVGGASVLSGILVAAGVLGTIQTVFAYLFGTVMGQLAMLCAAILFLRLLPDGMSGAYESLRKRLGAMRGDGE